MTDRSSDTADYPDRRTASLGLAVVCVVVFCAVINGNMVNVALPFIGRDFGVTEGTYGWLVTGFSLAFGIFNAIHGRLVGRIGLRRLYALGIATLGGTSLLLALAPNIHSAIALRLLQGAGSAALPALGTVIIARLFAPERRGVAMGWVLAVVGVGASIGPFLGGLLVQIGGWRLVFAATSVVLLVIPAMWRLLPASLDERTEQPFDLMGAILLASGVTAWLYAFVVVEQSGLSIEFFALLVFGAVCLALFVRHILRVDDPFADPALFADLRYVVSSTVAFLANATRFGTIVLVPIFLIEVNEVAPITVGLVLLPGALFIAVVSPMSGRIGDRFGARLPVSGGVLLIIFGNVVTALTAGGPIVGPTVGMALYGLGFAFIQSPLVSATSQILPRRLSGTGMGIFMMVFFLGGAFGVALSVTVVELQAPGASGWFGLTTGPGAVYSNAIFTLSALAVIALLLTPGTPGYRPEPPRSQVRR